MKKFDLGQLLNTLASLGVVAGVIFLAVELQQNTTMMKAQIRDSLADKQMRFTDWISSDPSLAALYADARGGNMSAEELRVTYFIHGVFREWENSFYQYEAGLYEEEDFEPRRRRWEINMRNPSEREAWNILRETFSPRFREQIDRIVEGVESDQTDSRLD